jgi:hypothetical protein
MRVMPVDVLEHGEIIAHRFFSGGFSHLFETPTKNRKCPFMGVIPIRILCHLIATRYVLMMT